MTYSWQTIAAHVRRWLTIASATLLIVLALLVGIGRELVKEVERFHAPMERWLSKRTALDVRFSRIQGEWSQASPELHLHGVSVANPAVPDSKPLRIARLSVRLSLSNTFLNASLRWRVRVHGAEAHFDRDNGQWALLGNTLASGRASSDGTLFDLLRNQPRLSVYDSRVTVDGVYGRRTDVALSFLKLFWEGQHAYLDGEAMLRGPDEMRIQIKSDVAIIPGKQNKFQGVSYVSLSQGQLTKWLPEDVASRLPVALQGGRGTTEVWLHWFKNAPLSATLRFDWRDVAITPRERPSFGFDRVAGLARWQGQLQDFWQFGLRDLVVENDGTKWRPATLRLNAKREREQQWLYQLSVADASLSTALTPTMSFLSETSPLAEALAAMQPSGRLQDAFFAVRHAPNGWTLVQAHGELKDYAQKSWQKVPGLQNAGMGFYFADDTLWLDFNETGVTLDYPAMFRSPLLLTMVQGSLAVKLTSDAMQVRSSPLAIFTPHGSAHTRLSLVLPTTDSVVQPHMALQVTLRDIAAEHASLYLPAGIIPEKLLAWLDGALKGGTLTRGDIVFNGPLRKPEIDNARTVLLGFQVEDGHLQFLPEWQEPIKHINGDVIVENGLVQAHAEGGEYYGLKLAASRIWTARAADAVHLHVATTGEGDAADGLRLLRESPLGKTLKSPLSDMELTGPLNVAFELDAPLDAKARLAGKAAVTLSEGTFKWPSLRLEASHTDLGLTYDLQKGLSSQKFEANFLGEKTTGRLYHQQTRAGQTLKLELKGKTEVEILRDWLHMPQLSLATGVIPYSLQMQLPPASSQVPGSLLIKSSLVGVAADLPAPFAKSAAEHRNLAVTLVLGGEPRVHRLRYDDIASVKWETQSGRWKRGAVHLGQGEPAFADGKPWRLSGMLSRFRWDEWADVIARMKPASDGSQPARLSLLSQFDDSHLTVSHLYMGDDDIGQVALSLRTDEHYVTLAAGGDRLRGRLTVPHTYLDAPAQRSSETPVSLYLQTLVLPASEQDEGKISDPALDMLPPQPSLDPRLLPAAHIRIDQLMLGDEERGRYNLTLKPTAEGVNIENLRMTLKQTDFSGNGRWVLQGSDAATHFTGLGRAGNVADVLVGWGYAPSIDSESAELEMDVHWPGAPYQFKLARTEGKLRAHLKDGHFLKVSNNAVGRVWGLLNFETWMSRMQLRFNDVSDNEMPFEEIRGRFVLRNNRVDVNKLRVESPALKMRMDGLVDMSERQLNMEWSVTVPVTRNLMLPAAVVGGLPGAATAYVLDKVLSSQLDKLTTLTYDVTGTFDQPQTRLRVPLQ